MEDSELEWCFFWTVGLILTISNQFFSYSSLVLRFKVWKLRNRLANRSSPPRTQCSFQAKFYETVTQLAAIRSNSNPFGKNFMAKSAFWNNSSSDFASCLSWAAETPLDLRFILDTFRLHMLQSASFACSIASFRGTPSWAISTVRRSGSISFPVGLLVSGTSKELTVCHHKVFWHFWTHLDQCSLPSRSNFSKNWRDCPFSDVSIIGKASIGGAIPNFLNWSHVHLTEGWVRFVDANITKQKLRSQIGAKTKKKINIKNFTQTDPILETQRDFHFTSAGENPRIQKKNFEQNYVPFCSPSLMFRKQQEQTKFL